MHVWRNIRNIIHKAWEIQEMWGYAHRGWADLTDAAHAWWEVAKEIVCFNECQRQSYDHELEVEGWWECSVHDRGVTPISNLGITLYEVISLLYIDFFPALGSDCWENSDRTILIHLSNSKAQKNALYIMMMMMLIMMMMIKTETSLLFPSALLLFLPPSAFAIYASTFGQLVKWLLYLLLFAVSRGWS